MFIEVQVFLVDHCLYRLYNIYKRKMFIEFQVFLVDHCLYRL